MNGHRDTYNRKTTEHGEKKGKSGLSRPPGLLRFVLRTARGPHPRTESYSDCKNLRWHCAIGIDRKPPGTRDEIQISPGTEGTAVTVRSRGFDHSVRNLARRGFRYRVSKIFQGSDCRSTGGLGCANATAT